MTDVAETARIGKPTLYLRWPDMLSLIDATLASWPAPPSLHGLSSLEGDLIEAVHQDHQELVWSPDAAFIRAVMHEAIFLPSLAAILDSVVLEPRRRRLGAILSAKSVLGSGHLSGPPSLDEATMSLEALTLSAIVSRDSRRRAQDPAPMVAALCRGIRPSPEQVVSPMRGR